MRIGDIGWIDWNIEYGDVCIVWILNYTSNEAKSTAVVGIDDANAIDLVSRITTIEFKRAVIRKYYPNLRP